MHINKITGLLVLLCSKLCTTIKVPVVWDESDNSAVKNEPNDQVETIKSQNVQTLHQSQPIPIEYFQYTAKKPQFAADIASFHGVQDPEQHYKAYPVKPYTGQSKPALGIHHMLNEDQTIYRPYQKYVQKTKEIINHVHPISSDYEVFHPYKIEEPALQEIYKDPVLTKIRNDLQDSKNRLQAYEQSAGGANITDDEHLEGIEKTDGKLFPIKNHPVRYEIHRPEKRPIYYDYKPPPNYHINRLNQRFRHPWNQQSAKIRPVHYKPLQNHIQHLRQHHAMKYDDERNEYPQVVLAEDLTEPQDGYDIYEKGKQKFSQLRNNVDESINKAVQQNRPPAYQKLELQNTQPESNDEETEFIPVKNYAQVRKTETFKHLPRKSAFNDAETYEEILNAPRLREAVKSTKAQTVYSEEGYEDAAYDHAGEQKHASDHEGHGGFLRENEKSGGIYKIPTVLGSYQDGRGSEYRDNIEHGKKWKTNNKDDKEEIHSEKYSEENDDESVSADIYKNTNPKWNHSKREISTDSDGSSSDIKSSSNVSNEETAQDSREVASDTNYEYTNQSKADDSEHEVDKREINFKVPEINLHTTYLSEKEILELAKQKILPIQNNVKVKYPYYGKTFKKLNENSPLRYAENLKLIPKKTKGGTEFYDSRSTLECPEVDDDVDPLPEKLKNGEDPTEEDDENESSTKEEEKFEIVKKQPRLKGLGDKIDCFKAKYFGEDPLDSPFFNEDIIINPEPITAPSIPILKELKSEKLKEGTDIFLLLDKLRTDLKQQGKLNTSTNDQSKSIMAAPHIILDTNNTQNSNFYTDLLANIKDNQQHFVKNSDVVTSLLDLNKDDGNVTYNFFQNKEDVTKLPPKLRRKRATPFVYEPYKIIRDSQVQDTKKTTTTSNISPLIRQLQSSRVGDRVSRSNIADRQIRSNNRKYIDIDKNDRAKFNVNPKIVDVSVDQRRGEPRYEIQPLNHKSEYTPVENKKAMSVKDYKHRSSAEKSENLMKNREVVTIPAEGRHSRRSLSVLDAALKTMPRDIEQLRNQDDDDDSDDLEDAEEQLINFLHSQRSSSTTTTTTTTSTTLKPTFRTKITSTTTTTTNRPQVINRDEPEKLKLITRFRNYKPEESSKKIVHVTEPSKITTFEHNDDTAGPTYTEKKKKSTSSTLVTDTKKYGEEDEEDKMTTKEVDSLMGIKQNMDDYMPSYEKRLVNKEKIRHPLRRHHDDNDDDNNDGDDNENDDGNYEEDDDDADLDEDNDNIYDSDEDDDEMDDEDDDDDDDFNDGYVGNQKHYEDDDVPEATTSEPPKRTLVRTTDAPPPTIASHFKSSDGALINKPQNKPVVTRKKIEIHTELPVNKSLPHVTQFKQDIKEVEIIKEIPTSSKKKSSTNEEALELYKDDNLAKDINNLEDVEIFRENLNLENEPKHGGNYRKATKEDIIMTKPQMQNNSSKSPSDAEVSQSEYKKQVELIDYTPRQMHGGNLKYGSKRSNARRNGQLIELDEDKNDDRSSPDDDYKTSAHDSRNDRLHGGNYRSAKFVIKNDNENDDIKARFVQKKGKDADDIKAKDPEKESRRRALRAKLVGARQKEESDDIRAIVSIEVKKRDDSDIRVRSPAREARRSAAALLNSYVRAAPVLTTTPGYVTDPSKRMYYYVDD